MEYIESTTFAEIQIDDTAKTVRTLTDEDVRMFAELTGDMSPAYFDSELARSEMFQQFVAHGMWIDTIISTSLTIKFPGPGTLYEKQNMEFYQPVAIGDEITVTMKVIAKDEKNNQVRFDCDCINQNGQAVAGGTIEAIAPTHKMTRIRAVSSFAQLPGTHHKKLIDQAQQSPPIRMGVIHPCDNNSFMGAIDSAAAGLIEPVFIGPIAKIQRIADETGVDLSKYTVISTEHSHESADKGVIMAKFGEVDALMKGSLGLNELLSAIRNKTTGISTQRYLSHVAVMDVPTYPRLLLITDAAVMVHPTLEEKVDMVQNAIDLAHALGTEMPKVAILSAVETVNPKIKATVDASALCKMADRRQITGGMLDGPLAIDNAISAEAAEIKGIVSQVAGYADILLAPDIEAGNMIAKQLGYLANAIFSGVVMGARVPIVLVSRADKSLSWMASSAICSLIIHHKKG
jgi:phosphotransacetylase/acyl dehydratase